jgi:hypothetical protein
MENPNTENVSLINIIVKYLRHWKLFLIVFLLSFVPAILYLVFYPRTYEFVAGIQIQEDKETNMASMGLGGEVGGLMKSFGIGTSGGTVNIDDEMSILASNRIMRKVILDLGTNVEYRKPFSFYKFYDDTPLKLTVDSIDQQNIDEEYVFKVSVLSGNINVIASCKSLGKENFTFSSLPARVKLGDHQFTLDYNGYPDKNKSIKLKIKYIPASWAAEKLTKK